MIDKSQGPDEHSFRARAHQQAAIARLGQRALEHVRLAVLSQEAVDLVRDTLAVDGAGLLEYQPESESFTIVAVAGAGSGSLSRSKVAGGLSSQAGYTQLSLEPIVVPDLSTETRFRPSPQMIRHGLVSDISVIVHGPVHPFGVLSANAHVPRRFTDGDIWFMQSMANVLAAAIERHRADDALRESEASFRSAFDDAAIAMGIASLEGRFVRVNQPHCALLGYEESELIGQDVRSVIHPDDLHQTEESRNALLDGGLRSYQVERRYLHRDGSTIWGLVNLSVMRDASGQPAFFLAQVQDITERKRAEDSLRRREQEFRALVENATDPIARFDRELRHVYVNPVIETVSDIPAARYIGRTHTELGMPDELAEQWRARLTQVFEDGVEATDEFTYASGDGSRSFLVRLTPELAPDGAVETVLTVARDITEHRALAEQLQFQALHDVLTGLPNRALLADRLRQALAQSRRHNVTVAVMFLDLDNFKYVNDSLGHSAGDQLLVQVARRLEACVREGDTIARFGGDEFAILLPDSVDIGTARDVAMRVIDSLAQPVQLGSREMRVTTSVGIALSRSVEDQPDDLLRWADVAMYQAKASGKNTYDIFDASMHAAASGLLERERDLRIAAVEGQILVHYQPVVSLATGAVTGVEALARWRHPRNGLMTPDTFLTLAEETSLIVPIGRQVIRDACQRVRSWQLTLPDGPPLTIRVNLSARQFREPGLVGDVEDALQEADLRADSLVIEVSEAVLHAHADVAPVVLGRLREAGVSISIDDFGVGYSSLDRLRRLPIQELKLDRSFVAGLGRDPSARAALSAAIRLAHELGLSAVVAGVETEQQVRQLRALGCDAAQGYFFARPLPLLEMDAWLDESSFHPSAERLGLPETGDLNSTATVVH